MSPGLCVAHYRIISKLGEGGMGAVYRAKDTKLGRDVAIKVLPDSFADDPDRLARFTREAKVLASLNHPNIAAIYGVEDHAIVMELVEGEEPQGPVAEEEALPLIQQLIEALEYAHEQGVVHRDLKPANVKVTHDGRLKVLDFGLARAVSAEAPAGDPASSPTLTIRATMAGVIMGTAAYMSPEQARGHTVDKRADIWSFGVVVYELLTGRQLFNGETVSDTLAAVLRQEPDYSAVPERFQRLLRLCLTRDPRKRLRDISGARLLLEEKSPTVVVERFGRRRTVWLAAALAAVAGAAVPSVLLWRTSRAMDRPLSRFSVDLGPDSTRGAALTAIVSPEGRRLAYLVRGTGGGTQIATRLLDQSAPNVLAGTDHGEQPFFSPDGNWIGFFADQKLKKVSALGGAVITLCDAPVPRGADWGEDGNIIASLDNVHLSRIRADGGQPEVIGKPEEHGEATWRWPQVLGDRGMILFTAAANYTNYEEANIDLLSLNTGRVTVLQRGGYFGRYAPGGHLLYVHQGTLFATPFDVRRLETRGIPTPVLDDVAGNTGMGSGQFAFSNTGVFVYVSGRFDNPTLNLSWLDSSGKTEQLWSTTTAAWAPKISPDGRQIAASADGDIYVYDLQRRAATRITFTPKDVNQYCVWTRDGGHLMYSAGEHAIWWIRADGSGRPQMLFEQRDAVVRPTSLSPDGRRLAFLRRTGNLPTEIWTLPLDRTDPERPHAGTSEPFVREPGGQLDAAFSPDGRWLAYTSFEPNAQVFVKAFPSGASAGRWQISEGGGRFPVWSRNGRELFYLNSVARIMVATYGVKDQSFVAGKPRQWASTRVARVSDYMSFDLMPDGKRFIIVPGPDGADKGSVHVTFLLNFFDELKRRIQ